MARSNLNATKVFFNHTTKLPNGCWQWNKEIHKSTGYGRFTANKITWHAHRFSYIYHKDKIPKGFHLHHLCNNRWCVNPNHLIVISARQHVLLGNGCCAKNARKTHCINGHEFTPENTYIRPRLSGGRMCRKCTYIATKKFVSKT